MNQLHCVYGQYISYNTSINHIYNTLITMQYTGHTLPNVQHIDYVISVCC